jgi:integrase
MVKKAIIAANIHKHGSCHTFRHYSACRIMPDVGMKSGEALAW